MNNCSFIIDLEINFIDRYVSYTIAKSLREKRYLCYFYYYILNFEQNNRGKM